MTDYMIKTEDGYSINVSFLRLGAIGGCYSPDQDMYFPIRSGNYIKLEAYRSRYDCHVFMAIHESDDRYEELWSWLISAGGGKKTIKTDFNYGKTLSDWITPPSDKAMKGSSAIMALLSSCAVD